MTDAETIKIVLKQARINGWDSYIDETWVLDCDELVKYPFPENNNIKLRAVLFENNFAKALWGLYPKWSGSMRNDKMIGGESVHLENFANCDYHLMQMVVADNPIAYLRDNMPNQND